MPPISGVPFVGLAEHRVVLESVIPRLDGEEPRRQRPAHRIRRTMVRAAAAIGAGIEVEHVLPGEVLERLHAERFHLVQMLVGDAPPHRLQSAAIQLREVDIEQRCLHVELDAERPVAEEEEERNFVDKVSAQPELMDYGKATRRPKRSGTSM